MTDTADSTTAGAPNRIVVGIDGSASSKAALSWAARQARLTEAPLWILAAWEFPNDFGWGVALPPDVDFEGDARAVADVTVAEVLGDDAGALDVTVAVMEGHPAALLVEESASAALAVVGSRGHGAFAGMLIGSVSQHLAAHAHCPVTIVRGPDEGGAP